MSSAKRVKTTVLLSLLLTGPAAFAADTHEVKNGPGRARVGEAATVSVTIQGKNGWHVNEQAPVALQLTPPAGVALEKNKLSRADLAESTQDRARFDVKMTASEAGTKTVNAEARFVMCQATACKPVKETVVLALEVSETAAKAESAPATAAVKKSKPRKPAR